jgi:hypothetical protein
MKYTGFWRCFFQVMREKKQAARRARERKSLDAALSCSCLRPDQREALKADLKKAGK